jgi:hypothetical protein
VCLTANPQSIRPTSHPVRASAARSAAGCPAKDKWFCTCGHEWNTFDTGGVCPACLHQWTETQCLSCSRWSPHSDWYAKQIDESRSFRDERRILWLEINIRNTKH